MPDSFAVYLGSSPRVWGTPPEARRPSAVHGLIPTGVGNTRFAWASAKSLTAHPHGCGEHVDTLLVGISFLGSSPRVWGTRNKRHASTTLDGLIPTGVGNTSFGAPVKFLDGAHPHGCGEHGSMSFNVPMKPGSSPRVWGTLRPQSTQKKPGWLIPTGVGNTLSRRL